MHKQEVDKARAEATAIANIAYEKAVAIAYKAYKEAQHPKVTDTK